MGQCECETTYKGKRETYKQAEQSFIKGLEAINEIQSTLKDVDYMDMKGRLYQNLGNLGPIHYLACFDKSLADNF